MKTPPNSFQRLFSMICALALLSETHAQDAASAGTDQGDKSGYGKFVSFKDGTLTLKGNYGGLVWNHVPEKTPVVRWDDPTGQYVPAGTAEVLGKVEAGTWTIVGEKMALIRVGARKGRTTGTFVSFKEERLLMLGKDLGPAYTKKYGNQLHMHKFAEDVPVFESIDGGKFEYAGNPATVLPKVKEGAVITVHGAGDDNITRIEIGVPKDGHVSGTFVSFKDERLLLLGKDLAPSSYTKKYGNQLHYGKFTETVPVYESIDGGDFELAGTPSATLPKVKEGSLVTVYFGDKDGSFTRIEIGVPKK